MIERNQVFRCERCGNIVQVFHAGGGELVCCGQPMTHLAEGTTDAALEKHVPVIEKVAGGVRVRVGAVAHPMDDKHYIQWIEVIDGERVQRRHLRPGDPPEAVFAVEGETVVAREYCNLHGHWKA